MVRDLLRADHQRAAAVLVVGVGRTERCRPVRELPVQVHGAQPDEAGHLAQDLTGIVHGLAELCPVAEDGGPPRVGARRSLEERGEAGP